MEVEITGLEISKNFKKLIYNLVKTTLKNNRSKQKRVKVGINFVDEQQIKALNKTHRKIDEVTDVLSFPTLNLKPMQTLRLKDFSADVDPSTKTLMLGDIVICSEVATRQAKEYNHSYEREICYLIVHGCLHLLGYDHLEEEQKFIMRGAEESVLKKYKITRD